MFTFWNYYVLKLLHLETITISDATLNDINIVLCYVLSQYHTIADGKFTSRGAYNKYLINDKKLVRVYLDISCSRPFFAIIIAAD
jgi:hypothetical protein